MNKKLPLENSISPKLLENLQKDIAQQNAVDILEDNNVSPEMIDTQHLDKITAGNKLLDGLSQKYAQRPPLPAPHVPPKPNLRLQRQSAMEQNRQSIAQQDSKFRQSMQEAEQEFADREQDLGGKNFLEKFDNFRQSIKIPPAMAEREQYIKQEGLRIQQNIDQTKKSIDAIRKFMEDL